VSGELQLTHRFRYRVGSAEASDGLARDGEGRRLFVPGYLPCGECPRCRRAQVGACASPRRPLAEVGGALSLPARFVAPVDDLLELAPLAPERLALAGPVAWAQSAFTVAGLAPADVAIWLGRGPVARLGHALAQDLGAHSYLLTEERPAGALDDLRARIAAGVAEAGVAHGAHKRVLLLTEPTPAYWTGALALAEAGSTFVALGSTLPAMTLPAESRVLSVGAYHPDFLPEAFAALRRLELSTADDVAVEALS
jgi:L-iditol 2-dehydrogenase